MSSSDVGSYEFQRSSWMQMEDCSAALSRSTSDGSADYYSFIRIIIIIVIIINIIINIIISSGSTICHHKPRNGAGAMSTARC